MYTKSLFINIYSKILATGENFISEKNSVFKALISQFYKIFENQLYLSIK